MKKVCSLLLLAAATLPAATLPAADYVTTVESTPGLLGYWRFTAGTGANSLVNGYTGTFDGDAALGAAGSGPALAVDPANQGVVLDGVGNTYVDTSLVGGINQAGSMVGWINLAELPSGAGRYFTVAGESQDGNDFDFQIQQDNRLYFYTNGGGSVVDPTPFTAADLNQWIFVAATFTSGGNATIYVNGAQVVQGAAGTHGNGAGTFAMGESDVFTGRYFHGLLDEFAVYNVELTGRSSGGHLQLRVRWRGTGHRATERVDGHRHRGGRPRDAFREPHRRPHGSGQRQLRHGG